MLRKFPNYGLDELTQIHIFLNGLHHNQSFRSAEEAVSITNRMALNNHQVKYNRGTAQRKLIILELSSNDAIFAQNKFLTQTVEELTKQLSKLP